MWTADFHDNQDLSGADRTYVAQVVAARTGMSSADAQKRVDDVATEAKTAADNARKGAAKLSFWLTAAMLFGAFAASLAAVEGGSLRDGTWNDREMCIRDSSGGTELGSKFNSTMTGRIHRSSSAEQNSAKIAAAMSAHSET